MSQRISAHQQQFRHAEDEDRFHVYSGSEKAPGGLVDKEYRVLGNHLLLVSKSNISRTEWFLHMLVAHSPILGLDRYDTATDGAPSPFAWVEPDGTLIPFAATLIPGAFSIWGTSQPDQTEAHEPDSEELALWNLGGFPLHVRATVALDILEDMADGQSQFERACRRAEVYWRNQSDDPADWWKK